MVHPSLKLLKKDLKNLLNQDRHYEVEYFSKSEINSKWLSIVAIPPVHRAQETFQAIFLCLSSSQSRIMSGVNVGFTFVGDLN